MKTPHADDFLAEPALAHPISPSNMRTFVYQLVRDNALDRARELAGAMVAWAHHAPGDDHFYYWLGVEQTMRALNESAHDRWRRRSDAKAKRIDAQIANFVRKASAS